MSCHGKGRKEIQGKEKESSISREEEEYKSEVEEWIEVEWGRKRVGRKREGGVGERAAGNSLVLMVSRPYRSSWVVAAMRLTLSHFVRLIDVPEFILILAEGSNS